MICLTQIPEEEALKDDGIELSLIGKMKDLGLSDDKLDVDGTEGSKQEIGSPLNNSSKVK